MTFTPRFPVFLHGGDYNMVTVPEVEKLAGGDGSGRIQR